MGIEDRYETSSLLCIGTIGLIIVRSNALKSSKYEFLKKFIKTSKESLALLEKNHRARAST